jgi:hypothetical protein
MSRQLKAGGSSKRPASQSRLPFERNVSPTRTNATRLASPSSTTLSTLESSQFQDIVSESNPEVSRASTPQSTTTKTKRKRTAWVFRHMDGSADMQTVFLNDDGLEV